MAITWNTPSVLPTMSWCIHQSVYGVSRHDLVTKSIPFVCLRFEKYFLSFDRFCRPTAIILLTFGLLKVIIIRKDSNAIPRKTMLAIFYRKYQSGEQLLMKVGLLHWDICPWNGVGEQCYVTGVIGITRSWKFLKSLILLPKMKFSWYQVGQWQCFYYIKVQIRQKTFTFFFGAVLRSHVWTGSPVKISIRSLIWAVTWNSRKIWNHFIFCTIKSVQFW